MYGPWGKPQQMKHFCEEKCLILQNNSCSFSVHLKHCLCGTEYVLSTRFLWLFNPQNLNFSFIMIMLLVSLSVSLLLRINHLCAKH